MSFFFSFSYIKSENRRVDRSFLVELVLVGGRKLWGNGEGG
jgi:hypothetical protein